MLLPMLMNIALANGKLTVDADAKNYRLCVKTFGMNVVLSTLNKDVFYQMTRTPEMPAKREEYEAMVMNQAEPSKALADDPVPLPVKKEERKKPSLTLIPGGAV